MSEIVQADSDALRGLGKALAGHADAIDGLKVEPDVTMPGSPVHGAVDEVGKAAQAAFRALGKNIRQMSQATQSGAKEYDDFERAFVGHFRRLQSEKPS
ncbi:hypothetical protein NDR87_29940 [Nocardia sp. CDC159]|uniref:Excreted virulence factor EspC (Type VII ESX diderm) n=1 Tax=Nocardia pulmonis TaxID=2951408 RepID=A0A9X2EG69_9NOCA|nr:MULTISPECIES: hypothetical protein [Nocardia]MCM6777598.1 hypothetical protein [Nocardia pulmonis]MCM6790598.1 hypothetical protein [Nocardia sp. CDC159]